MSIVTISRQAGSGGDQIAHQVCKLLGYSYFDKALMAEVAQEQRIADAEVVDFSEDTYRLRGFIDALLRRSMPVATATTWTTTPGGQEARTLQVVNEEMAAEFVALTIRALRKRGRVVVVGRGGQAVLRDDPGVFHVRIVAPLEHRIRQLMEADGLTRQAAASTINDRDRATTEYLHRFHGIDWSDATLYHLTLNASRLGHEAAAETIATAVTRLEVSRPASSSSG